VASESFKFAEFDILPDFHCVACPPYLDRFNLQPKLIWVCARLSDPVLRRG
jgi:hypothetical protein